MRAIGLAAALILGLLLRFYLSFVYGDFEQQVRTLGGDAAEYVELAFAVAKTGRFGNVSDFEPTSPVLESGPGEEIEVEPSAWRPPLWPVVLAILMWIADFDLSRLVALRFLTLDAATILLFAFLLQRLAVRPLIHVVSLVAFALHPAWLIYARTFLSEPLSLFMHLAFVTAVLSTLDEKQSLPRWLLAAVLGGGVLLAHPFFLAFPFVLWAALAWCGRVSVRRATLASAIAVAVASPWIARNMMLYDTIRPLFTTSTGNVVAMGWNEDFLSEYRNTTAEVALSPPPVNGFDRLDPAERSAALATAALRYVRDEWRLIPAIVLRKLAGAATPIPETYRGGLLELGRALLQILTLGPVVWLLCFRRSHPFHRFLLAIVAAYLFMALLTYPSIRFRAPIIWAELAALGVFLQELVTRLRGKWSMR